MKYAVIQTGGKQYRVAEGDILSVERLDSDKDQKITFNEVLLYTNDGSAKVGTPFVDGISVAAIVVDHLKGEKIRIAKYKAKARYRRVTGHRQSLTKIKIEAIGDGKTKKEQKPEVKSELHETVEAPVAKPKTARAKKTA